jgi:hypothetical protein
MLFLQYIDVLRILQYTIVLSGAIRILHGTIRKFPIYSMILFIRVATLFI